LKFSEGKRVACSTAFRGERLEPEIPPEGGTTCLEWSRTTNRIGSNADFTLGTVNTTGNNNILLGAYSKLSPNISNAAAIGWRAMVTQSNSLVLGSISGVNFGTDTNVGIGTTAPKTKLHLSRGRLYVDAFGQGVILKSAGGSCFEVTVSDAGALTFAAIACP